ncbi:MAG: paraquat-inducible protein A [Gammaproteobacteria bacterium]
MNNFNRGISGYYPFESKVLLLLLVIATICRVVGLVSPILTLEKFFIVENSFSIISGLLQLVADGKIFLFVIIFMFSVVLPVAKLAVLFRLLSSRSNNNDTLHRYLHLMHQYGKWSMLDVFVVALLVVAVKLGAVARVETHFGLYAFGAAVLLTMAITARVIYLAGRVESSVSR